MPHCLALYHYIHWTLSYLHVNNIGATPEWFCDTECILQTPVVALSWNTLWWTMITYAWVKKWLHVLKLWIYVRQCYYSLLWVYSYNLQLATSLKNHSVIATVFIYNTIHTIKRNQYKEKWRKLIFCYLLMLHAIYVKNLFTSTTTSHLVK